MLIPTKFLLSLNQVKRIRYMPIHDIKSVYTPKEFSPSPVPARESEEGENP